MNRTDRVLHNPDRSCATYTVGRPMLVVQWRIRYKSQPWHDHSSETGFCDSRRILQQTNPKQSGSIALWHEHNSSALGHRVAGASVLTVGYWEATVQALMAQKFERTHP